MLDSIKGFLIDMDGVIYKGKELIPGAKEFIDNLLLNEVPFRFLTNNSQRTRRDIKEKLSRMDINVTEDHIFTCAIATARYLAKQKPEGTAYVIGEGGLITALYKNGYTMVDNNPDFVVVGEGRTFNMENIDMAVQMIYNGAKLIGTNPDVNCPVDTGVRSGCGALIKLLEEATGKKALTLGKPSPIIMREAKKEIGLRTHEIAMIGDTMETDILGGLQMGFHTVLVLSGGQTKEELSDHPFTPNQVLDSVKDLNDLYFEKLAVLR